MNGFEITFFEKYLAEDENLEAVIHMHFTKIINRIFLTFWLFIFLPIIIYYYSDRISGIIPFYVIEIYLIFIYLKLTYDLFDWYNDVWIITNKWIINMDWSLFSINKTFLWYENIEAIEISQKSFIDRIWNRWDIILHQFGEDEFVFEDAKIPYEAIWEIEKFKSEAKEEPKEENNDKFDMVINTLSEVVKTHINWQNTKKENEQNIIKEGTEEDKKRKFFEEKVKEARKKEWTIDLR